MIREKKSIDGACLSITGSICAFKFSVTQTSCEKP